MKFYDLPPRRVVKRQRREQQWGRRIRYKMQHNVSVRWFHIRRRGSLPHG